VETENPSAGSMVNCKFWEVCITVIAPYGLYLNVIESE
jgi:hypothetical protein